MSPRTDKQRQWAWFVGLWCAGLLAVYLLAAAARVLLSLAR